MKTATKAELTNLHYRLLQAAHAAQSIRESLAATITDDTATQEFADICVIEGSLVELESQFSHLWSR